MGSSASVELSDPARLKIYSKTITRDARGNVVRVGYEPEQERYLDLYVPSGDGVTAVFQPSVVRDAAMSTLRCCFLNTPMSMNWKAGHQNFLKTENYVELSMTTDDGFDATRKYAMHRGLSQSVKSDLYALIHSDAWCELFVDYPTGFCVSITLVVNFDFESRRDREYFESLLKIITESSHVSLREIQYRQLSFA